MAISTFGEPASLRTERMRRIAAFSGVSANSRFAARNFSISFAVDRSVGEGGGDAPANCRRQIGHGANDGLQDRQGGHTSRATQRHNYKDGDRGYSSSLWSTVRRTSSDRATKDQYKASYRQAYIEGYEKGYNSQRGSDRR